ncbi:MAG TPA: hypothetical protein VI953_00150 [Candidatus Paceibacterota bacterium]
MQTNAQRGNGSTIAIVIVVIVLIAGAIYMWRNQSASPTDETGTAIENDLPSDESANTTEAMLNQQSNSDDINSIEADLRATSY